MIIGAWEGGQSAFPSCHMICLENNNLEDISKCSVESILQVIGNKKGWIFVENNTKIDLPNLFFVKLNTLRLQCFAKSLSCILCGIKGEYFLLQRLKGSNETPHLNLYAVNSEGERVLMTKDHLVPKSKGGKDTLDNLNTMCFPCNVLKGSLDIENLLLKQPTAKSE